MPSSPTGAKRTSAEQASAEEEKDARGRERRRHLHVSRVTRRQRCISPEWFIYPRVEKRVHAKRDVCVDCHELVAQQRFYTTQTRVDTLVANILGVGEDDPWPSQW